MTSPFDPISFGAIEAPNRIMMAPLTRGRATRSHVPTPLMAEYCASRPESSFRPATRQLVPAIRRAFKGALILNSDYHLDDASQALYLGEADAITSGRPFLANPDLPARFAKRAALNPPNTETFYTPGPTGYTDYPALVQAAAVAMTVS